MLIGLIVSFEVSEAFGLIILVIGFGLGITGRIYSRKESAKFSITDNLEPSEDKSKKTEEVVSEHPVNMIRCKNCGTTFQDSYIKCPNCGAGHS
jgi:predicted Zn-ribbon and HTH transcriptional regulator